jgi:hypothetical protein
LAQKVAADDFSASKNNPGAIASHLSRAYAMQLQRGNRKKNKKTELLWLQ